MAFKDREKQKEYNRLLRQKQRQGVTKGVTEDGDTLELVTPSEENVTPFGELVEPDVTPPDGLEHVHDAAWAHLREYVSRDPRPGDTDNLTKIRRIAWQLAHMRKETKECPVWFGGLDMATIGRVIGMEEYELPLSGPVV